MLICGKNKFVIEIKSHSFPKMTNHTSADQNADLINVEKIIKDKNPKLLKILPRPILNFLKKKLHEREFNSFLNESIQNKNLEFVKGTLDHFNITLSHEGLHKLPIEKGCIVVCNHPLGGLDGIAIMQVVGEKRKDLKAIVNDVLMSIDNLKDLLVPVNKFGANEIQNIKRLDAVFSKNECVIIFPAGLVSRKQKGVIEDLEWKKSFISKSIKYQLDIIPVYIEAKNSKLFYGLANWRKRLKIKKNIELFLLVDEVYKQKGKRIQIVMGSPISWNSFTKERNHYDWAQIVKEHVYKLKDDSELRF